MARDGLLSTIGDTPLVELRDLSPRPGIRLFAKVEGQNPSGSIKDRIALAMVEAAEAEGRLKPGDTLVEASTGNTAIALAMVARRRGYRFVAVVPEGVVPSIGDILGLAGVRVISAPPRAGMLGAIERVQALAVERGWVALGQFDNLANPRAHAEGTGAEILRQLPEVDVLVAGIGTGGTLMGAGGRLRAANPEVKLVGVEPRTGDHLQGLRSMDEAYYPPLVDLDRLDARYLVSNATALRRCHEIFRTQGLLAGASSGAALHAALRFAERLDHANIVVVFADGGWKYLPSHPWHAAEDDDRALDDVHWW